MFYNFQLLVVHTILITSCVVAANDEVMQCGEDLLPGISKLTYSVDITELDLFTRHFTKSDGFKRPIIELTCSKNKKFKNTHNNEVYAVPDQVLEVFMTPSGESSGEAKIYNTVTDIQESLAIEVGLDVSVPLYGSFSSSNTYKRIERTLNSDDEFISSISASVAGFRVDGWNGTIGERVLLDINRLPENYSTDPSQYHRFIENYGTHYFTYGIFGGKLKQEIVTSRDLRKTMNDKDISAHVEASFMGYLKVKGGVDINDKRSNELFSSNSRNNSQYYGGMTNLMEHDHVWNTWWKSVAADPWLCGGKLTTIDEIFPKNSPRKASIQLAVKSYLIKKALPLYHRRLDNFINNNQYGLARAMDLKNQLVALITTEAPIDPNIEEDLLRDIDSYIKPPRGWFEHTRLCYGCTSTTPSVCPSTYVCFAVNDGKTAMQPPRQPNTSGSGPTGLFYVPNLPWLNETKICFVYKQREFSHPLSTFSKLCATLNTELTKDPLNQRHFDMHRYDTYMYVVYVEFDFDVKKVPGWFSNTRVCTGFGGEKRCYTLPEIRWDFYDNKPTDANNRYLETDSS